MNLYIFNSDMKKFILHIILFSTIVFGTIFYILLLADGHSDSFYLKLTTPKKTNLIIGTSKAAQGIQPHILKETLHKDFYNYAFAIYASPYGEVYLNSIKQKLDKREKDNIFILTIDAWSICTNNEDPDNPLKFRENKSFLNDITNVCQNPNFKYLISYFEGEYNTILLKKSSTLLHDNGWLEVSLDENGVKRRTKFTIKDYQEMINYYHFSNTRFLYLLKTIDFLNQYGKVYLVRLPVHPDLMAIEETLMPKFNKTIQPAKDKASGYLDLTLLNKDLKYTDGVHLNKSSGEQVSDIIAKWIKDLKKERTPNK
jgi:hypothetical protein